MTYDVRGSNVLHTNWVYKTKATADGDVERLKARLVACDDEQAFGNDYVCCRDGYVDGKNHFGFSGNMGSWSEAWRHP